MINETIQDIESRIQAAKNLETAQKKALLSLVESLKSEVLRLSTTHGEDAASIADFVRVTTGEGLKENQNPKLLQISLDGIHASVEKFEVSHPLLTQTVNSICNYFSGMGI